MNRGGLCYYLYHGARLTCDQWRKFYLHHGDRGISERVTTAANSALHHKLIETDGMAGYRLTEAGRRIAQRYTLPLASPYTKPAPKIEPASGLPIDRACAAVRRVAKQYEASLEV